MQLPHFYSSLQEAIAGSAAPVEILQQLRLIHVPYLSFTGDTKIGQLVVHTDLAEETIEIFKKLYENEFPIEKITPVVAYDWNDEASMADNNTSAFNYREIIGKGNISNHSHGRAIDINPLQNPYFAVDGNVYPAGSAYEPQQKGTITAESYPVTLFKEYGWRWLGERKENTDYQHFDKPDSY